MLIYFQVASLFGGGDKYASPYMAIRKPLLVTILKSCNPKRFKPTNYKRGKVNARDRYNILLSTVKIEGLTLRQKLEQVIQSDDYKDLSEPVKINQGVSDGGGKFERINYFYNRYKDEAELLLKNEMKDFKYTKDDRRTLKRDMRLQDENIKAIGQSNRTDETLKEKLKDLNDFSNQIN